MQRVFSGRTRTHAASKRHRMICTSKHRTFVRIFDAVSNHPQTAFSGIFPRLKRQNGSETKKNRKKIEKNTKKGLKKGRRRVN